MSEETTSGLEETQQTPAPADINANLQSMAWDDKPIEQTKEEPIVEKKKGEVDTTTNTSTESKEGLEPNVYLKNKWGFENEEAADNEIKTLREKATKGYEYKNPESQKVAEYINEGKTDELYQYLDTQKRIDKLSKADLSDKSLAAELVKFGLQRDNPTLNSEDIEFLFNQKYSIPAKPIHDIDNESDEDYAQRLDSWKLQVQNIERGLVIEAKMNQPKLAQLKTELVLPNIQKENQQQFKQPTQEDLVAAKQLQDSFVQYAEKSVTDFKGFDVQVKDKDVNYTGSYNLTKEQKAPIANAMKQFAETNFDANAVFAERWLNADKTINVNAMIKDLARIYNGESMDSKLVLDAANKQMASFIKEKKQINVGEQQQQKTFEPTKTEKLDSIREQAFA